MPAALRHHARQAAGFVQDADILIGIVPDLRRVCTARAVKAASAGLGKYFPGIGAAIAVCGSAGRQTPAVDTHLLHLPGQDPVRLLIELADALSAKVLAILDPESPAPESIDSLVRPVLFAGQDFAAPVYRDTRGSGLLAALTLHPMMRCLHGRSVRNPAPSEFALSRAFLAGLSRSDAWISEAARRAPSLWIASEALTGGYRCCDTVIPGPMPAVRGAGGQVAGLLALAARAEGPRPEMSAGLELFGALPEQSVAQRGDRAGALAARFLAARRDLEPVWRTFLRKETVDRLMCPGDRGAVCLSDGLWAHVLFELAEVFRERSWFSPPVLETFPMLFGARAAAYHAGIGTDIERSCQVFEAVRERFERSRLKGEAEPCLN